MVIVAAAGGDELRELVLSSYDFEVSDTENSFEILIRRDEWEEIPDGGRLFIPGTEYGGLFKRLSTNTKQDSIAPGGLTWRGMLQRKIIQPAPGMDYATATGELNTVISGLCATLSPLFMASPLDTGVTVNNYQFDRYCTLYEGLREMLESVDHRLELVYSEEDNAVVIGAVPIHNYATDIEFSSNMRADYVVKTEQDMVNHLICLGSGQLSERMVHHLYTDERGRISQTQTFFGVEEIAAVYDNSGASEYDLVAGGRKRLKELRNRNTFSIDIDTDMDIAIGDIVGGRDYLTGIAMQAPVVGKVVKMSGGVQTIEYTLGEAGEVKI